MKLVRHDANLWSAEHEFGWQGGLVEIPVRMTVIRLANGQLILHSPIPIGTSLRSEIDALGTVGFLVVPEAHGRFAEEVSRGYPDAALLAAPKAPSRRQSLAFTRSLANDPPQAWAGEVECFLVEGFRLHEVVLFHPPSRTLVVTDLCFNIHRSSSRVARLFFELNGMWRYFGPSRLIRWLAVSSRSQLNCSLERILRWDFERVIPGHGDVVEDGGPGALCTAWRYDRTPL